MADKFLSNPRHNTAEWAALNRCYQELVLARQQLQQQQRLLRVVALDGGK